MSGKVYSYAVVTSNGAGVHSTHERLRDAKAAAERLAAERFAWGYIEIERIEHVGGGSSRRYWMRQGKRWVNWVPRRSVLERKPDWLWDRSETRS